MMRYVACMELVRCLIGFCCGIGRGLRVGLRARVLWLCFVPAGVRGGMRYAFSYRGGSRQEPSEVDYSDWKESWLV